MKQKGSKRAMGLTCLAIGGVFLFNPVVAVVDVLPNLIGYLLIYAGLWRLSDLNDEFGAALRGARTMIIISLIEIALWWVCYYHVPSVVADPTIEVAPNEEPMAILLAASVSAVLNFCFLIPMLKNLFAGFATAAIRMESCVVNEDKKGVSLWTRMTKKSARFVLWASVLSVLPELTVFTSIGVALPVPTHSVDLHPFTPLLRGTAASVSAIIGLLWLISYLRFFAKVRRDRAFCDSMRSRYEKEILPQTNWLLYRRYALAGFWATLGLIFSAQLTMDNRSILPGFVCAIFLMISVAIIGVKRFRGVPLFYTTGVVFSAISLAHEYFLARYVENHELEDALHLPRAYEEFYRVRVLECAEVIATAVFLFGFFWMVWQSISRLSREKSEGLFAKNKRKFAVRLCLSVVFAVGAASVGVVNAFLQLEIKYLWWIALLLSTMMLFTCRTLLVEIREELYMRAETNRVYKDR